MLKIIANVQNPDWLNLTYKERRFWIISQVWLIQSYFHALRVENAPSLAGSKKSQQPVMRFSIFVKIKKTEREKLKFYKERQLALALTSWKQKPLKWCSDELEDPNVTASCWVTIFCYINWLTNGLVVCREVCMHMEVIIWVLGVNISSSDLAASYFSGWTN